MKSAIIIGAGVVGTACAYELRKAGWGVTLLDRGRVGGACSHGNCGYVCPSHVLPLAAPGAIASTLRTLLTRNSPLKVSPWQVMTNLGWFRNFAKRCNQRDMLAAAVGIQALLDSSRTLYDDLLGNDAIDCDWQSDGLLFVFHQVTSYEHYHHVNDLLTERFGRPAIRYDADALVKLEPALKRNAVAGGYLYEGDAQLRPDKLMAAWRNTIGTMGVTVIEDCEFKAWDGTGIETNRGVMTADAYVFATGAWTPRLEAALNVRLPILPGKGYSITMPRPANAPKRPMIFEDHRVAVSPFASGYRIGSTMEFAGYDETISPKRLELLTDAARFYLHDPVAEPVQETWFGWRPMVYDGKPVIDFAPGRRNVLIAAGHGMLGLSMATGTGKLVAELLNGETTHIPAEPYRFK
jgi:D-amino-acid dehydrogenase